jgi:hypothetical protein
MTQADMEAAAAMAGFALIRASALNSAEDFDQRVFVFGRKPASCV